MRRNKETAQFVFLIVIGLLFLWIALESRTFPRLSRTYPQTLAIVMLVVTVAELGRMWWNQRRKAAETAADSGIGADAAEFSGPQSEAAGSGAGGTSGEASRLDESVGATAGLSWSDLDFATRLKAVAPYILWILGYFGLIYLIGFLPGSFVFAFVSATWIGKLPWFRSLLTTAVVVGVLYYLGKMLSLRWPGALLF